MSNSHIFGDKDANSQRRKREEEQVELRRQRTEELLNKKRVSAMEAVTSNTFDNSKKLIFSTDLETIYKGVYDARTILSVEINPPIDDIINIGIVPRFVELLDINYYRSYGDNPLINKVRYEAAWVLTNIASGNASQTRYIVNLGVVPILACMLNEDDDQLVDQCIWALGNIAGDNEELRDTIISTGVIDILGNITHKYTIRPEDVKILRNLVWFISNLNRGRNPVPKHENMLKSIQIIEKLVEINDADVISDCFWAFSYIVDASTELADLILRSPVMARLYRLLSEFCNSLQGAAHDSKVSKPAAIAICPMIRLLGNIVAGTEKHTDMVLNYGFLDLLHPIFYLFNGNKKISRVRKEICWLLSNITAGTESQTIFILESNLIGIIIDSVARQEMYVRKEAGFAILNCLHFCIKQTQYLQRLLDNGVIRALQNYMESVNNIPELQIQILQCVQYALEAGAHIMMKTGVNPVVPLLIDSRFIDEIEELQDSKNQVIVQKAYNIIITYFEGEDENL